MFDLSRKDEIASMNRTKVTPPFVLLLVTWNSLDFSSTKSTTNVKASHIIAIKQSWTCHPQQAWWYLPNKYNILLSDMKLHNASLMLKNSGCSIILDNSSVPWHLQEISPWLDSSRVARRSTQIAGKKLKIDHLDQALSS